MWAKTLRPFSRVVTPYNLQHRCLHLHEYQSMELLQTYKIPVPKGYPVSNIQETNEALNNLEDSEDYVLKAQVLAGGRGLGHFKEFPNLHGIHICSSLDQVKSVTQNMLGSTLITRQTGETGKKCGTVLITERFYIRREKYVAVMNDRQAGGPLLIGSSVGGTSIEAISESHPDAIVKMPVDINKGLIPSQLTEFCKSLGFTTQQLPDAENCINGLYNFFIDKDCTLVEINPLVETNDGRLLACDAKLNFDDNAEFRHKDIFDLKDTTQEDPREVAAQHHNLNYVGLSGNIGCMVNGAGLAMATLDMLKLNGGEPANFLDVGGGADGKQVIEALRILQDDSQVKVIFINIFGGIMRCDIIALGLIQASQQIGISKPLVVRLEGTNQDLAKDLLDNSGLKMTFTSDFEEASRKAVKMCEILNLAEQAKIEVSFDM